MKMERELENFIKDLRGRPVPPASHPNYLAELIRAGERQKLCIELETLIKICKIDRMRKRK